MSEKETKEEMKEPELPIEEPGQPAERRCMLQWFGLDKTNVSIPPEMYQCWEEKCTAFYCKEHKRCMFELMGSSYASNVLFSLAKIISGPGGRNMIKKIDSMFGLNLGSMFN